MKGLLLLFSSGETHIKNQVAFLKTDAGNWRPIFVVDSNQNHRAVRQYWSRLGVHSYDPIPLVIRTTTIARARRFIARLFARFFGSSPPAALSAGLLRRIRGLLDEPSCGPVAWSHGDPTNSTFAELVDFFGPSVPLYLVDDGAASRFLIRTRAGVPHQFFPSNLNPGSSSFLLSRRKINRILFVTNYVEEKVHEPDSIMEAANQRLDLAPSEEIWIAGSPVGGRDYVDFALLALSEMGLSPNRALYLPHPKEGRSRLRQIRQQISLVVPEQYHTFELFVHSRKIAPAHLLTLPSTVVDMAVILGIEPRSIRMWLPDSDWLPYPSFYAQLANELQTSYPGMQAITISVGSNSAGGP